MNLNPILILQIKRFFVWILFTIGILRANAIEEPDARHIYDWKNRSTGFEENKGQMLDSEGNPVPFVLFKSSVGMMDLYLTETGLTYVFVDDKEKETVRNPLKNRSQEKDSEVHYARVDMILTGAVVKRKDIVAEYPHEPRFNYYLAHCPNGIAGISKYRKLTIKNIYEGIDWVWYSDNDKGIKYEFVVHPGADPEQIKMAYRWCDVTLGKDSSSISIRTPLGELQDGKLESTCQGKRLRSAYVVRGKEVGFVTEKYDKKLTLIIDPPLALTWGTYFGGNTAEGIIGVTTDLAGDVYATGYSTSTNLPVLNMGGGAYFLGSLPGASNMIILKFNNYGTMLWCTYYGGNMNDEGWKIVSDANKNIFIVGGTSSQNFPTQNPGGGAYFQSAYSWNTDMIILKFNSSGVRKWATYYGGGNWEYAYSASIDNFGNLFVTGQTNSANLPLKNPGGGTYFQSTNGGLFDIFILKFDTSGVSQWATYYGGSQDDCGNTICNDMNGNVYVSGLGRSSNLPVQNPGGGAYFQGTKSFNNDGFILKFNNAGVRQSATYFGGGNDDVVKAIACNSNNDLILIGGTASTDIPLQNPGGGAYYVGVLSSTFDLFISKLTSAGILTWSTYYGGTNGATYPYTNSLSLDASDNIYVAGSTEKVNFPTLDPGGGAYFQSTFTGARDVFLIRFDSSGVRSWATLNGTSDEDWANCIHVDHNCNIFTVGEWTNVNGSNGLKDPGGTSYFQGTVAGNHDSFIMKFKGQCALRTLTAQKDINCPGVCTGIAVAVTAGGNVPYSYSWQPGGQTTSTVKGLCAGNYTVTVTDSAGVASTALVNLQQAANGLNAGIQSSVDPSCNGYSNGSASVSAVGGTAPYTYSWNTGQSTSASGGLSAATYSVTVKDANNCSLTITVTVTEPPALQLTASALGSTCTASNGSANATAGGGSVPYTYVWSANAGNQTTAIATGLVTGNYTVVVTDIKGCSRTQTVFVPNTTTSITVNSTSVYVSCAGYSDGLATVFPGGGMAPYTYSWSNGQTGQTSTGLSVGIYTVSISDSLGCVVTASVQIQLSAQKAIGLLGDSVVNMGGAIQLSGYGGHNYQWGNGDTNTTISVRIFSDTVICLSALDSNNCPSTICIKIGVSECKEPFVPNVFSPNEDGKNDLECVFGDCVMAMRFSIFDRWGNKVFETTDPSQCWNGDYLGKRLSTAVFVYYLEATLLSGKKITKKGNISLIR